MDSGDEMRNIPSSQDLGTDVIYCAITKVIERDPFHYAHSLSTLLKVFPSSKQADIKSALQCIDLETHYDTLSPTDIDGIKSQMVDKVDPKSVEALNNVRFLEFPINLQFLM